MVEDVGDAPCWAGRVGETCGALAENGSHVCPQATRPLRRRIVGFHLDEVGDWVAELSCLHNQHVRHRPPFQLRPWVLLPETRAGRIGTAIDCLPCARAELPEGLAVARRAGPFDAASLPGALVRDHVVADGMWGRLHIVEGIVTFSLSTEPPTIVHLGAGDRQAIPWGPPRADAQGSRSSDPRLPDRYPTVRGR